MRKKRKKRVSKKETLIEELPEDALGKDPVFLTIDEEDLLPEHREPKMAVRWAPYEN